jgi:5,10-methylenetetrahydromethanopterin reductase
VFSPLCVMPDRKLAYQIMAPFVAGLLDGEHNPALEALPFISEMRSGYAANGVEALAGMPHDYWSELGAIGTMDDAVANVVRLGNAGANRVALFPAPIVDVARADLVTAAKVKRALA